MTEQPTTPEPPVRPMPRLGHGVHWPTIVADIDRDQRARARDAEPVNGLTDHSSTPSLGAAGSSLGAAMHTCADHCQCDETRCSACADSGHVCENHPDRPWAGVSDDINACDCGGAGMPCPVCCDPIPEDGSTSIGAAFTPRKFAAGGLVRLPSDPADDVVPFPVSRCLYEQPRVEAPVVDLTDRAETFESGGEIESPATFMQPYVAELLRRIPPGGRIEFETIGDPVTSDRVRATIIPPGPAELRAMADDLNTHGGLDETFVAALLREAADPYADAKRGLGIVDPPPVKTTEPISYEAIVEALEKIAPLGPQRLDVVKLTQEQIDAVTASQPHVAPSAEPWHFFGTPVELVETVEESTPYELVNARPGGIVEFPGELTDAEFETLRADWLRAFDAKPRLSRWTVEPRARVVPFGEPFRPLADVLDEQPATEPRPWWRRTLDRVRRSL